MIIFLVFFSFCFVQATKTFRLGWRISLYPIDTYLHRLVYNPPTQTGPGGSHRGETRSTVPRCMCLKGNGTTIRVALECITSAKDQPITTPRWSDASKLIFTIGWWFVTENKDYAVIWVFCSYIYLSFWLGWINIWKEIIVF